MSYYVDKRKLYEWCSVPVEELAGHPDLKVPFRLVDDSAAMGELMATEFLDLIESNNNDGLDTRAIVPCGPNCWYEPWRRLVREKRVSLQRLHVFHMDECLDWQGNLLPNGHPYNFRASMERDFYAVGDDLTVPESQRHWLEPATIQAVKSAIAEGPIDITLGGWGQDGHIAYNQARREPFSPVSIDEIAESSIRIQNNNLDTVITLAQRTLGTAYQFVPPMSVTLGVAECMSAGKVRVFSDTGAWKATALRVALFSEPVAEYPLTLLQRHPDALITASIETARHPISLHPEWELFQRK